MQMRLRHRLRLRFQRVAKAKHHDFRIETRLVKNEWFRVVICRRCAQETYFSNRAKDHELRCVHCESVADIPADHDFGCGCA